MQIKRKRRLLGLLALMSALALACALVLYALSQNIDLYFTPSQLGHAPHGSHQVIRVGGWVKPGSVQHLGNNLAVRFTLTDHKSVVGVDYRGVLPSLFHEGQGVVVQGIMVHGKLHASTVLAKHDANYHPPGVV